MSIKKIQRAVCPACHTVNEYTLWDIITADTEPYVIKKLLNGVLFECECTRCKRKIDIDYDVFYHDTKHRVIIRYLDKMATNELREEIITTLSSSCVRGYRARIVTSQEALTEKALIFYYGLDDRVIEIIKYLGLEEVRKHFLEAETEGVRFGVNKKRLYLSFYGKTQLCIEVTREYYARIAKQYSEIISADDGQVIINGEWARRACR